jgi:hypothetical protein
VKTRELQGATLILGFASELLKEKMEKPENIDMLQSVMDEVLPEKLSVKCLLASHKAGTLPQGVDSSGMVATAVGLGGEIVDKTDLGKSTE